ncbi:MAG: carbamoyl-phosphate synthase small subunit [Nitrospinota bacterium]|nr:MAG: carbamoyl-phosphate synthase small subunit [Nitrospinota bacterium]
MKKALLALADGTTFVGEAFGAEGEAGGEVVFNTNMTGYQEVLTDPSYKGQIVVMTYPLIGNYGVNGEDFESARPQVEGFVIKEGSRLASNWRGECTLEEFLREHRVVGIQGIDTRALTRHIRTCGAQMGIISTQELDPQRLVRRARELPPLLGRDLVREVTCTRPYRWQQGVWEWKAGYRSAEGQSASYRVVAYDLGIKYNILRQLVSQGCEVYVVPAHTPAQQVLAMAPDGLFLSNGPGDPEGVPYVVEQVRQCIGKLPIFGICLGHQILALAFGGKTYKLKFGHRGGNQPVKNLLTGRIEITAHNHGFAVDAASLPPELEVTHINLNDQTVEGLQHRSLPVFSVQYHPEASPGPHDSHYLFQQFVTLMQQYKSPVSPTATPEG